jgi:hypothetical protein
MRDEWLPRYDCLLQPDDDDHERDEVAEGPSTASLDEALAWAYPRARKVLVRPPWDTGRHYLADGGPPDRWKPID